MNNFPPAGFVPDLMRDLRTGLNVIHLQEAYAEGSLSHTEHLGRIVAPIRNYYTEIETNGFQTPPQTLLTTFDDEIGRVVRLEMSAARDAALNALTALRCTLFPQAEGYIT